MNKKLRTITLGTIAILIMAGTLFYLKKEKIPRGNFTRKWINISLKDPVTVNLRHNIISIVNFNGDVFLNRIFDIAQVNPLGKVVKTISLTGEKIVPNEYIIGLDADSSGLYLQDEKKRTITKVSYDGNLLYQKKSPLSVFRSVHLSGDSFLLKSGSISDNFKNNFFAVYNADSKKVTIIDTLMPKNGKGGMDTDGALIRNQNGNIFHFYFYMSGVLEFDSTGKPVGKFATIDGNNTPPPVITNQFGFVTSPDAKLIHPAAFADEKHIYVASNVISKNQDVDIDSNITIDVYDVAGFKYAYSLRIPNITGKGLDTFLVHRDHLYIVTGSKYLTIYKI